MVDAKKIEFEFKKYMDIYKADPELGHLMQQMTFQELFNEKFMKENSKFTSMDDMLFKSDFGLTNPLEIEKVNQDKLAPVRQAGHDRMDEDGHRPVGPGEGKTGEGRKEREEGGEESPERKEIKKKSFPVGCKRTQTGKDFSFWKTACEST